jgi:hypothetical protein
VQPYVRAIQRNYLYALLVANFKGRTTSLERLYFVINPFYSLVWVLKVEVHNIFHTEVKVAD